MHGSKFRLALMLFIISSAGAAYASNENDLGKFGAWTASSFTENGHIACYIAASPAKAEGKYKQRESVFFMVTHRPGEDSRGVVSFMPGYSYPKNARISLIIDGQETLLYGADKAAWTETPDADAKLVAALRKGSTMIIKGESNREVSTTDTFSLKGFSAAMAAIDKKCNENQ